MAENFVFGRGKGGNPPLLHDPKPTSCSVLALFGRASFGPNRYAGLSLRRETVPPSPDAEETNGVIRVSSLSVGAPTNKSCRSKRRQGAVTLPLSLKQTTPQTGCQGDPKGGKGLVKRCRKLAFRSRNQPLISLWQFSLVPFFFGKERNVKNITFRTSEPSVDQANTKNNPFCRNNRHRSGTIPLRGCTDK